MSVRSNAIFHQQTSPHSKGNKSLDFDMTALNINGIIFFFTQGEPFCEYQMETRSTFKKETVFFAGYTNGQNAYLASKRGYQVRKGYEYEIEQMHIYQVPIPSFRDYARCLSVIDNGNDIRGSVN